MLTGLVMSGGNMRRIAFVASLALAVGCGGGAGGGGGGGGSAGGGGGGSGGVGGPGCEVAAIAGCCATGEAVDVGSIDELHGRLHGRWQICAGAIPDAADAEGIEFRDGAFWQLLKTAEEGGALIGDAANMGWQIEAAEGTCGEQLTLFRSMGGRIVADVRIYEDGLRLDFETGSACFTSIR